MPRLGLAHLSESWTSFDSGELPSLKSSESVTSFDTSEVTNGEVPTLKMLVDLDNKLSRPVKLSRSEEVLARRKAATETVAPRIEGDDLIFTSDSGRQAREAAVRAAHACLQCSLAVRETIADQVLEPREVHALFQAMGKCAAYGSNFTNLLYAQKAGPPAFEFKGPMDTQRAAHREQWEKAVGACRELTKEAAASSQPAERSLALSGNCMRQIGKAFAQTAGSSCCALPLAPPISRRCRCKRRVAAASFFSIQRQS